MKVIAGIVATLCIVLLAAGLALGDSAKDLAAEHERANVAEQKAAYAQGQAAGQAQATGALVTLGMMNSAGMQVSLIVIFCFCGLFLWSSHALTTQNNERYWQAEQDRRDKQHQIQLQQAQALEVQQARMLVQLANTRQHQRMIAAQSQDATYVAPGYTVKKISSDYPQLTDGA